jgi:hypothetical protein
MVQGVIFTTLKIFVTLFWVRTSSSVICEF